MTTFRNAQSVQNQSGRQIIHGDAYFYGAGPSSSEQPRSTGAGSDSSRTIDDDILYSLAFPQMFDRRSNIATPHAQTCQWIFSTQEYQRWRADKSSLLWIKGKPGSGKSTLMACLYRHIWSERPPGNEDQGICLEFFFSARGVALQRTALGMLRSLLNQLFRLDAMTRDVVRTLFQDKDTSFGKRYDRAFTWEWQRPELEVLLMDAILATAQHRQITILVDALDEAGEREAHYVAHYFHIITKRVVDVSTAARICIACRHYPIPSTVRSTEVCVEQYNHYDIAAYVQDYIDLKNCPPGEGWLELVQDLIVQSRGVFQWICLVTPMVERHMADGDLLEDIRRWIRQLPLELEDVYKHILQNVVDHRHRVRSFELFHWVCLAVRPLSVTELRFALSTRLLNPRPGTTCEKTQGFVQRNLTMEQQIKSCSGGLIEATQDSAYEVGRVEGDQKIVQVIHQSVKDFFLTQGVTFFAGLLGEMSTMTVEECHGTLYWSCLKYMAIVDTEVLKSEYVRPKVKASYPLLEYAVSYLLVHAREAQGKHGHDIAEECRMLHQVIPALEIGWDILYPAPRNASDFEKVLYPRPGTSLLHITAFADLLDVAKHLLEVDPGGCVDAVDNDGQSALHIAAEKGCVAVAEVLLSAGADLEVTTLRHETALTIAARRGHTQLFRCLLRGGARVIDDSEAGVNTLYTAAQHGRAAVVKLCIQAGATVDSRGPLSDTALIVAASGGFKKVLKVLIDAGADVNNSGGQFGSALIEAAEKGFARAVKTLIKAGADVNFRGGQWGRALHAAIRSESEATTRLLIKAGADVDRPEGPWASPLHEAVYRSSTNLVSILIHAGADVNARNRYSGSVLETARRLHNKDIVNMLVHAGATG